MAQMTSQNAMQGCMLKLSKMQVERHQFNKNWFHVKSEWQENWRYTYLLYSTISGSQMRSQGIRIRVMLPKSCGFHMSNSSSHSWSNQTLVVITWFFSSCNENTWYKSKKILVFLVAVFSSGIPGHCTVYDSFCQRV